MSKFVTHPANWMDQLVDLEEQGNFDMILALGETSELVDIHGTNLSHDEMVEEARNSTKQRLSWKIPATMRAEFKKRYLELGADQAYCDFADLMYMKRIKENVHTYST